jgi:hypothetical protein
MSELIQGKHTDPAEIKPYITMAINFMNMARMLIPSDKAPVVNKVIDNITQLLNFAWFAELIAYLMNTFADVEPTQEQLAAALQHFTNKVAANEPAPKAFVLPSQEE